MITNEAKILLLVMILKSGNTDQFNVYHVYSIHLFMHLDSLGCVFQFWKSFEACEFQAIQTLLAVNQHRF